MNTVFIVTRQSLYIGPTGTNTYLEGIFTSRYNAEEYLSAWLENNPHCDTETFHLVKMEIDNPSYQPIIYY